MKLSIVIPAYNEEKRITKTLEDYYDFFNKKLGKNFEIIIVVNNSKDNTIKIAEDFAEKINKKNQETKNKEQIKVLNYPYFIGKGGAVMRGFEHANAEYIGFTDADNSTTPENFFKLIQNIKNAEGIIASRRIKGAKITPPRKLSQNISSFIFNKVVRILFNLKYKDTQCGAKLFKKSTAYFLAKNYTENAWGFDVDLLYLCRKTKRKIIEYPIIWTDAEGSKVTLANGTLTTLKLFKYKFKKMK